MRIGKDILKKSFKFYSILQMGILSLSVSFLVGCPSKSQNSLKVIRIDGSSTVFPITEAASEEFQKKVRGQVRMTVGVAGTGGGFKKLCRNEIDFQNASRSISEAEMKKCKENQVEWLEIELATDAIVIITHPQNNWLSEVTADELKKMWEASAQNQILHWDQVNPKWPHRLLSLYGASTDNGTFDYFTEAINHKAKSSRGDYTASVDHNTRATGVAADSNSLGYIPYPYYLANRAHLKLIAVKEKSSSKAVLPDDQVIKEGLYRPLSRPLYLYLNKSSLKKAEVRDFLKFYLTQATEFVQEVGYIPKSPEHYRKWADQF